MISRPATDQKKSKIESRMKTNQITNLHVNKTEEKAGKNNEQIYTHRQISSVWTEKQIRRQMH